MINKFLNAKHWQLFTLMYGIPFVFQIVVMLSIFANILSKANPDPTDFFIFFKVFPIILFLYAGTFLGWFWSVAIGLQKYIPTDIRLKIKKFKICFFLPIIYILFVFFAVGALFYQFSFGNNPVEETFGKLVFVIIIPLHLLSLFCMFYLLYFMAKTIKTAELKQTVHFSDFIGEFFMIWFFPIGVWFIQPRIHKIIAEKNINNNNI